MYPSIITKNLSALQMKTMILHCPVFYDRYKKAVDLKELRCCFFFSLNSRKSMRESIFEDFTLSNYASSFPRRRTVVAGRVRSAFGILGVRMQRKAAWKEVGRGLALFKRVWSLFVFSFTVFCVFLALEVTMLPHSELILRR